MPTGTVKWFNNAKGYGFILADEGGEDLFAHYSAIQMEGYRTLKAGQQVNFDIIQGDKGYHAANITMATADAPKAPVQAAPAQTHQERAKEAEEVLD
ncbi:cold shock domain-containing protein CspD [Microbulbifer sp. SA54]|uniref:cold shock domain-containing protein CspD n=1 Tax=Microbulbifer sp. SA54 TaxID=3401577 RepID=UPI003AAE5C63